MKIREKFSKYCQKGAAFVLACTMAGTMSSCSKKELSPTDIPQPAAIEVKAENVNGLYPNYESILNDYGVTDVEDSELEVHKYKYLVDITKVAPEERGYISSYKLKFYESFDIKTISTEKDDEKAGIADYWWSMSRTPVANNVVLQDFVIPDCYSHYFCGSSENGVRTDLAIYENMKWFYSEQLLVSPNFNNLKLIYSRAEVDEDISKYSDNEYYTLDSKSLKVGDVMESYSLYLINGEEETLVGFIQTGAGSDSQNVQDKIFGDMSSMITTVEQSGLTEGQTALTAEEFSALKEQIKYSEINENGIVVETGKVYQK